MRRILSLLLFVVGVDSCCPNNCMGHGKCLAPTCQCECHAGYIGGDCSLMTCPSGKAWVDQAIATDNAHNEAECSNMGLCDRITGLCSCLEGFAGLACQRNKCALDCNLHGQCQSMQYMATQKDRGLGAKTSADNFIYKYEDIWDYDMMYGCKCDDAYFGYDCSMRKCPLGDDPLTGQASSKGAVQYDEKQKITCKATSGTFTLTFRKKTSEPIPFNAEVDVMTEIFEAIPTVSGVTISYAGITTTACTSLGNEIFILFTQDFNDVPLVQVDGSKLVHKQVTQSPVLTAIEVKVGDKENEFCSNRGVCDPSGGICTCTAGFDTSDGAGRRGNSIYNRGDCGYAFEVTTSCPGEIACSGGTRGSCTGPPNFVCVCANGWQGADCSERVCISDVSWFDMPIATSHAHQEAECSNAGLCERSKGECVCAPGFVGTNCEKLICPGNNGDCNGVTNGVCVAMNVLATVKTDNGDATAFTYGDVPNDPPTWDFDKIQGCHCHAGFEGYDCSLFSCPTGDDPLTRSDNLETQVLRCQGTTGAFAIKFRQQITTSLDFSATEAQVKEALEALSSIGSVSVIFTTKKNVTDFGVVDEVTNALRVATPEELNAVDVACTADKSNQVLIQFLTELGDVPDATIILDGVEEVEVHTDGQGLSVLGTKENIVCNGRGLCDHSNGWCKCFEGFTSSDGQGREGERGDCGFIETLYAGSMSEQANTA